METAERIGRLRDEFGSYQCDAMLITNLVNIRYLTGFTGSAAMLLVLGDSVLFTTDGRYAIQSRQQLSAAEVDAEIVVGGLQRQRESLAMAAAKASRLGLEAQSVTWSQQTTFETKWFTPNQLVATNGAVEQLRLVKDAGEVARIEQACHIADRALAQTVGALADRPTEAQFALELDFTMRKLGAEEISFDTIVASGRNGAKADRQGDRGRRAGGDRFWSNDRRLSLGHDADGVCGRTVE
jgi:Xaa-Pro aminopeptidase